MPGLRLRAVVATVKHSGVSKLGPVCVEELEKAMGKDL